MRRLRSRPNSQAFDSVEGRADTDGTKFARMLGGTPSRDPSNCSS